MSVCADPKGTDLHTNPQFILLCEPHICQEQKPKKMIKLPHVFDTNHKNFIFGLTIPVNLSYNNPIKKEKER